MTYTVTRQWHVKRRPTVFSDTPQLAEGVTTFSTVRITPALAQQLADSAGGAAYVDGHHAVIRADGAYLTEAAQWFGQALVNEAGAEHCAKLWAWLNKAVAHYWRDSDVHLLATPGSAGRDLWLRTIDPYGKGYMLQADDIQNVVRETAHQARVELFPSPAPTVELDAVYEYDLRLAYMSVARDLPTGRPVWRHDTAPTSEQLRAPGRWWVEFTVPAGWTLPGILPVKNPLGGWQYPTAGTWATVVDGCELSLAMAHGWSVKVERALLWPERCDPYRTFFNRLLRVLDDAGRLSVLSQRMTRNAVRALALHTVGAMHGAQHRVSRHGAPADVPADAETIRLQADGTVRWVEYQAGAWPETSHPEWTAHLWARARYRVLSSPGGGGILSLPSGTLVAVRTDAVYTTTPTTWADHDDGKPGRWVHKGTTAGPIPWPSTHGELLAARDRVAV